MSKIIPDTREGKKNKSWVLFVLLFALTVILILCMTKIVDPTLAHLNLVPLLVLSAFPVSLIIYIWLTKGLDGFNRPITNATLTCKNGHTGRVWVNTSFRGGFYMGTYKVSGSTIIIPDACPKCGAEWEVPDKKHGKKHI